MKKYDRCKRALCLCLSLLLALSLAACNSPTDEQNSAQPTPSTQPTAEPTPTPPIPYTDVPEDAPYYDAVVWAYENGIASEGETFGPTDTCTRKQAITFLWRAKGSPEPQATESPFSDVSSADWFYKSALWAYESCITAGTAFNPGNPCSNADVITFLWRAEGKPAASMYNSAVALSASGKYYARPAAWAETNGLFDGTEFDPAAPCTRADLMAYLHWDMEEWTFTEEDKAVQAKYEQIVNDAQLYEVYGTGLVYADYVDVDNDGKVELLTLGISEDTVTATVYANIDGHAGKYREGTGEISEGTFSICAKDGQMYLRNDRWEMSAENDFYIIENGTLAIAAQLGRSLNYRTHPDAEEFAWIGDKEVTVEEYDAELDKYMNNVEIFSFNSYDSHVYILERGLLPDQSAVTQEICAAVKNGDFSAIAGNYEGGIYDAGLSYDTGESDGKVSVTINKDGTVTGDIHEENILSITQRESGEIYVETEYYEGVDATLGYTIYPPGYASDRPGDDPSKVRVEWFSTGGEYAFLTKIS